ncbi:uncharacterized protein EV420DRAFT_1568769 [Desarmillaria tabescens]|uniref:Uncharacterized protein n=1 Tax=Armillaria tabescens TaxID=1929756 RepID=A0AA39JR98_ARMTA|nr:uncharacterized protein EV420DRAFT_1568769 [Desarmillaria tabescens]KAK0447442.1 hypothetical protein EV420DRAFT_1568769 [Desarmillaria tabescens]
MPSKDANIYRVITAHGYVLLLLLYVNKRYHSLRILKKLGDAPKECTKGIFMLSFHWLVALLAFLA